MAKHQFDLWGGFIRFVGWLIICLTTEGFGMENPRALFLFSLAVMIEVAGLAWSEKQNNMNGDESKFRRGLIVIEGIASFLLIGLYLVTFSGAVSVLVGGGVFYFVEGARYTLNLRYIIYLPMYIAPPFCAILWVIRASVLSKTVKRRSLFH
ncbi:MAG: hypothetical protein FWC73_10975 [Defluviitaleaceae bacterium]|nr:hypothetical protein [Defluviitaleaceae bacterium]